MKAVQALAIAGTIIGLAVACNASVDNEQQRQIDCIHAGGNWVPPAEGFMAGYCEAR